MSVNAYIVGTYIFVLLSNLYSDNFMLKALDTYTDTSMFEGTYIFQL